MIQETDKVQLETLLDQCGLSNVLQALAGICWEKADHINANYYDSKELAKLWAKQGDKLSKIEVKT